MKLTINGENKDFPQDTIQVSDLVTQLGFGGKPVAVEVNKQLVPKRQHETTTLNEGDNVELVTLVGGG